MLTLALTVLPAELSRWCVIASGFHFSAHTLNVPVSGCSAAVLRRFRFLDILARSPLFGVLMNEP